MSNLQETVKAIYEDDSNAATFGPIDRSLPPEWTDFFQKRAKEFRKQEPEPKPEPEKKPPKEPDSDVLAQIIEALVARLEAIETRLELIEAVEKEVEERIQEPVRKGLNPEIFLLKMELEGACGELRDRGGRKWQKS